MNLLEMEQVLILWDRLLGYMDLNIFAVMAAAVFVHRSDALFQCSEAQEAAALLEEGSRLRTVPLLQTFLFSETE